LAVAALTHCLYSVTIIIKSKYNLGGFHVRLISYRAKDGGGVMTDNTGFVALDKAAPDLPKTLRGLNTGDQDAHH
jgi:hypothetical protein